MAMTDNVPEFTAYELNALNRLSHQTPHYKYNVKPFVMNFVDGKVKWEELTDRQRKYLWAIKFELKGIVDDG